MQNHGQYFLVQQYRHLHWVLMIRFDHSLLFHIQNCRICCKINYCTSYHKAIILFLLPLPNMTKGRVIISLHHCSTSPAEYCSKFLALCFGFLYNEELFFGFARKLHAILLYCLSSISFVKSFLVSRADT